MSAKQLDKIPKSTMLAAWAIALGAIAPMLDSTMINIAIDDLTQYFDVSLNMIQWGVTGYILAMAIAVPFSGWLMDQFNSKIVYISSVALFGVISVLTGLSESISLFILFRVLQGFSAGIISTLMSTLLVKTAGHDKLGRVMAIVSIPMILGPILGPVIGGFIIHFSSWKWIFYINIFVTVLIVPLMIKKLPSFMPFNKEKKLDWFGISNLSLISFTIIYGITKATENTTFINKETIISLVVGGLFIINYLIYNRMKNYQTVLPTNLFKYRNFATSSSGLFLANIAIMGPMIILPLFFQQFKNFNTIEAATALMPQGIGMLIARPMIGKLTDQYGAKKVILICLIVSLLASIPLVFVTSQTTILTMSIILFMRGVSVGGILLPFTTNTYVGLKDPQLPQAGITINIVENIGASFGSAIIATVVATMTRSTFVSPNNAVLAYQIGFLIPVIILVLLFICWIYLPSKEEGETR
ncbi:DHA2 family efflux MFS transporter permease subunit [Mammaliicoccus lentus]|uniref:DHA2 family efflux MFS transporter permease subunit n=1 Tax=Mammaliicoccus lentus TaxID=42858 RepID=UPI001071FF7E|nr:DHA2 family efflux MFS transporter permease subunit [Mammaliicoccus lentus]MBF0748840.1 DHA2 family efflux MFS transporter permease subunit [Mammaliicoccus lentus]TFU58445.1 DHA2 family efflux MFS transporter permease subunit [Mammaliicoccus lentus]